MPDIDGALEYIMTTMAILNRGHKRGSPQYINLAIIEHSVNNFCHWSMKAKQPFIDVLPRFWIFC